MSISFCFDQPPYLYYLLNRNSFVPNWNMFSNLHFYLYSCCNIPSLSFCNGTKVNTSILKWAKFGHNLLCQIWGLCSSPSYSIEGAFRFTTNVVRFASPSTCVTTHEWQDHEVSEIYPCSFSFTPINEHKRKYLGHFLQNIKHINFIPNIQS